MPKTTLELEKAQIASLYITFPDDLEDDVTGNTEHLSFATPIQTSFTYGLIEEMYYLPESIHQYVISFTIKDEEHFVYLDDNKVFVSITGAGGVLHEAFLLFDSLEAAQAIVENTFKSLPNTTACTIYQITKNQDNNLVFHAVFKKPLP